MDSQLEALFFVAMDHSNTDVVSKAYTIYQNQTLTANEKINLLWNLLTPPQK